MMTMRYGRVSEGQSHITNNEEDASHEELDPALEEIDMRHESGCKIHAQS